MIETRGHNLMPPLLYRCRGQELVEKGLNGIWNVGKAAEEPPAMITLQFTPENDDDGLEHVCWVGKGIIYDTGGLSLKSKTGMPGMKMDMVVLPPSDRV